MISFQLPSLLQIAAAITTILIIHTLHKYFVRPYFLLQRFKKYKDGLCIYRPIFGTMREYKTNFPKHGDAAYDIKRRIKENPSLRFTASSLLDTVFVTIYDPNLIKQFLNKDTSVTVKYTGLTKGTMSEFGKHSLLFTEGEKWKRLRRSLSQVFHFDYMNNSLPIIRATTQEWIVRNCRSSASPCVVNVSKEFKMFTSTALWRILFGENNFTEDDKAVETIGLLLGNIKTGRDIAFSVLAYIFGSSYYKLGLRSIDRQFMREGKMINEIFYSKLNQLKEKQKLKSNGRQDGHSSESVKFKNLIDLLLEQSDGLSEVEIIAQISTFFLAGTETTSEFLTISQYLLATHPKVQNKLREEVLTHIGKTEEVTYDHISKMEYLNAVIKEAFRFGGPSMGVIPRIVTQNFMLNEIEIKKGTVINVSSTNVAYNTRLFSNPEEFRPERWIEKVDPGTIDTSTHLPFSAGGRKCMGEQLALIESKVILCELVRSFKIDLKTPYKFGMAVGIVYRAEPDVNVIYTPIAE